ncbi:MAG: hypothetical protein QOI18_497 [Solirubrobacteraceae bacterium]|nr:hypothetical protein [Solirubrobacteraceae bacterium]
MDLARKLQDRLIRRAFASGLALALAGAIACGGPAMARAAKTASTPAPPVAATERTAANTTAGTPASAAATAPGAATTPTTTYAPSGGATAPSGAPGATPSTATTPPGVVAPAPGAPATSAPAAPGAQAAAPTQKSPAQTKAGKGDRPLSTGAIVIAVLAALLVLVCAAWALARSSAFEPHWLLSLRHAMAEAGFRASATWSEFADWARLGR